LTEANNATRPAFSQQIILLNFLFVNQRAPQSTRAPRSVRACSSKTLIAMTTIAAPAKQACAPARKTMIASLHLRAPALAYQQQPILSLRTTLRATP
jgi:hypothetical protein